MSTPQFGLLPKEPDARDLTVGAAVTLPKLSDLPDSFYLPYDRSWILEQAEDSCAGHASSLISSFQEGVRLDPLYTWIMARKTKGMRPSDWGCDLRAIADAHRKIGALELVQRSFQEGDEGWREPENWDTPANRTLATPHRKGSYVWIERTQGYDYFDTIRASLFKFNTSIVIGMRWPYSELPFIDEWQEGGFGHAIAVVGYEKGAGKDYLIIANSWGTDSGRNGEYFIAREVINKELPVYGGFTFIDETPEKLRYYIENGIKLDDNALVSVIKAMQTSVIDLAKRFIRLLQQQIMDEQEKTQTPREKLYQAALESLGKEMSPQDQAPDDVACAESASNVIRKVHPTFPVILHTRVMLEHMEADKRFKKTNLPKPGNIIISPTGTGNGTIKGHVGIHLGNDRIASNTSKTGLWEDNFSVEEWVARYRTKGGMQLRYFELV